jgi:hypothetical protein
MCANGAEKSMIAVILALVAGASLAEGAPASLTGTWLLRIDSSQGPRDVDVELEQDGTTLTGTYVDERGASSLKGRTSRARCRSRCGCRGRTVR